MSGVLAKAVGSACAAELDGPPSAEISRFRQMAGHEQAKR
jgi:hypothetical protein